MARPTVDPYIYKRGETYYGYFSRFDRRSLNTKDHVEAAEKFTEILGSGTIQELPKTARSFTEIAIITHQRASVGNADKTVYELGLNLKRITTWLEQSVILGINNITKDIVEQYKAYRTTGDNAVGPARVNRELANWLRVMRVSVELGCFKSVEAVNAMFEFIPEPKPDPTISIPSKLDLEKFFQALDTRFVPLVRTALGSGLRAAELRHIQRNNILALENNRYQITVTPLPPGVCCCCKKGYNTKNYRYRKVPISKETYQFAHQFLDIREELGLHKKSAEKKIWNEVSLACAVAGIKHLSMHAFRHAFASFLLHSNFKIADISKWLGHKDVKTTIDRYIHIIESDMPDSDSLPF